MITRETALYYILYDIKKNTVYRIYRGGGFTKYSLSNTIVIDAIVSGTAFPAPPTPSKLMIGANEV